LTSLPDSSFSSFQSPVPTISHQGMITHFCRFLSQRRSTPISF
jgi:hypothetical protein